MLAGEFTYSGQIFRRRDPHARLTLNRLKEHRDNIVSHCLADGFKIAVRDQNKARSVRPEMIMRQRIVGEADDRRGTTVKIAASNDDLGPTIRHAFHLVPPLASDLDRRL